jgi:hypothetical protein
MAELDGVRVKLARATEHLDNVERAIGDFGKSQPYTVVFDDDPNTGEQIIRARNVRAPGPIPAIGDALYNFRSGLDHLAWELVKRAGNVPILGRTEFPIFNDPTEFAARSPGKLKGMKQPMIDAIKDEQPCFGTNPYKNRAIWSLQQYGNTDKHRELIVTVAASVGSISTGYRPGPTIVIHGGAVEENCELARFPRGEHIAKFDSVPGVAFGEPPALGEPVDDLLRMMEIVIRRMVDEFEAAFF